LLSKFTNFLGILVQFLCTTVIAYSPRHGPCWLLCANAATAFCRPTAIRR